MGCSSPPLSSLSPGLARGWRGGGRTAGLGLRFSATLAAVPGSGPGVAGGETDCWTLAAILRHSRCRPRAWSGVGGGGVWTAGPWLLFSTTLAAVPGPDPGEAGGGGGLLDLGCSSPLLSSLSPGLARGWRGGGRTAGLGLLLSATLAAVPGPGPEVAGDGRAAGGRHRRTLTHTTSPTFPFTPPSPPPPSLCTFITIPPAAIVKPQGFLVRGVPHQGAAGVRIHLTLSHASHRPSNLSDSPPAERDTCCLSQRAQETPSESPRWRTRPFLPPPASSRCWSLLGASPDTRTGVPPRCRRRGGRGLSDCTTTPPSPLPCPANPTPPHAAHAHMHSPLHAPWPSSPCEAKLCSTVVFPLPHLIP